jgi:probable addiction module antidote protein
MAKRRHRDFNEYLMEKLKDPELAQVSDEDQRVFLLALKNVLEAQGKGVTSVAHEAHLSRQNIYKALSRRGNPQLHSLRSMLHVLGYELAIQSFKR